MNKKRNWGTRKNYRIDIQKDPSEFDWRLSIDTYMYLWDAY